MYSPANRQRVRTLLNTFSEFLRKTIQPKAPGVFARRVQVVEEDMGRDRRRLERTWIVFVSVGYDFGLRGKSEWEVEDADLMSLFKRELLTFRKGIKYCGIRVVLTCTN